MKVLVGVVVGFVCAWVLLVVLSAVFGGSGVGPLELLLFGGPAFAFGYWLTTRQRVPER